MQLTPRRHSGARRRARGTSHHRDQLAERGRRAAREDRQPARHLRRRDINENDADVDVQTVDWPGEPGVHITARADHTQVPASPTQPPQPLQLTLGSYLTLRIFTTELLS